MQPKYRHDCIYCLFTGHYLLDGEEVDGWYCWRSVLGGSVILRHGDEPSAYSSVPASLVHDDVPDDAPEMLVYKRVLSDAAAIRTGILKAHRGGPKPGAARSSPTNPQPRRTRWTVLIPSILLLLLLAALFLATGVASFA